MKKYYVLHNPLAGNGNKDESYKTLKLFTENETEFLEITNLSGYKKLFESMRPQDVLVICGGDGTLNRFVNDVPYLPENDILYYPTGSGNDFWRDLAGKVTEGEPYKINEYLVDLPSVEVNGVKRYFLNNVGYGIDGYCCEVGDKLKLKNPDKKVNYTAIAIKGLLFDFKTVNAEITVDGVQYNFDHVWLAPTMNGKFYGGGMIPTPNQDRLNANGELSVMVMKGRSKIKTLMIFPKIFKGEHVKYKKAVTILTGKDILVKFDKPTALQIDGETVLGVTEYHAVSGKIAEVKREVA